MSAADMFLAYDEATGGTVQITRQQMTGSLMALAAACGRGTACAGVFERQALEVARGGTAGYSTVQALDEMRAATRKAAA